MIGLRWIDDLETLVGRRHVFTGSADLAARDGDGRGAAGRSVALVRPGNAQEVAATLALAARHGLTCVPQGARTGLVAAGTADESGSMLLLSSERLVAPLEIDPVNRTVRVGAGVTLSQLNEAAAAHGLFFPIDLGADPTVGGMIAANTGGARFLRYGDVRRNLLAVELAVSSETGGVLELGRPCWKQNDGVDLKQMAIGTSGAMGIVTAATLSLQPTPVHRVTALFALRDQHAIEKLLVALEMGLGGCLTAFEGMSPAAYEAAVAHVSQLRRPFARDTGHRYFVLAELSGGQAFDDAMLEAALATVAAPFLEDGSSIAEVAVDRRDGLWAIRHAVPEGLRATGIVIGCDVAMRRGDVSRFRDRMRSEIARVEPRLEICDFGHVGDGGVHFNMVWPHAAGPMPPHLADTMRLRVAEVTVDEFGGSFSAEHGIGPRNIAAYQRFTPHATKELAGRIQALFSPVPIGRVDFGAANASA